MPEHRLPTRLLLPFTHGVEMEALGSLPYLNLPNHPRDRGVMKADVKS